LSARSSFLEDNLRGTGLWIKRALLEEETSNLNGLLQSLEPRVKLISLLALLLLALLTKNIGIIIFLYGLSVFLAFASGINIAGFLKRVWVFIPLFTVVIALPALFLTPGAPLFRLGGLIITKQGFLGVVFLVSRVAVSVSISTLLILTTKWNKLLFALRSLGISSFIVLVLAMCYRYIFVLVRMFNNFLLARKSKLINRTSWRDSLKFTGRTAGVIFIRSLNLAEDVYLAMVSRGFDGEVRASSQQALKRHDYEWIVFVFLTVGVLVWKS